ncbi:unnamed protein product [Ostreobium quekettii]|uniref:Uncharacterized protein n=1 Tax=Ostreobium quekettii TaxID=121088 RepID=A0A8S1J109_9CHLO|nr:unnamed protein product [Ostreobium quekettii]
MMLSHVDKWEPQMAGSLGVRAVEPAFSAPKGDLPTLGPLGEQSWQSVRWRSWQTVEGSPSPTHRKNSLDACEPTGQRLNERIGCAPVTANGSRTKAAKKRVDAGLLSNPTAKASLQAKVSAAGGTIPSLCACHSLSPLDPSYTDHCCMNCPLYKNPKAQEKLLKSVIHTHAQ